MTSVRDDLETFETSPITGFDISFPVKRDDELSPHERLTDAWDIVEGFPLPRFKRVCGCGSSQRIMLSWSFTRGHNADSYRCCMNFICRDCGEVSAHRIPIAQDVFEMRSPLGADGEYQTSTVYMWREALEIINAG